jgi:hypothetical protein
MLQYTFSFTTPTYDDYTIVREALSKAGEPVITIEDDGDGPIYSVTTTIGQANLIECLLAGAASLHWASKVWYTLSGNEEADKIKAIWVAR